jgi:hypothetical protein
MAGPRPSALPRSGLVQRRFNSIDSADCHLIANQLPSLWHQDNRELYNLSVNCPLLIQPRGAVSICLPHPPSRHRHYP